MQADWDFWEAWDKVAAPTLVLRGAVSDLLSAEVAAEMTRRGPKAELVTFAGIGHAPVLMAVKISLRPSADGWRATTDIAGVHAALALDRRRSADRSELAGEAQARARHLADCAPRLRHGRRHRRACCMACFRARRPGSAAPARALGPWPRPARARAAYMRGTTWHLLRAGYPVLRLNLRGAGPGRGKTQQF